MNGKACCNDAAGFFCTCRFHSKNFFEQTMAEIALMSSL